ncbi:MAG: AAA family ATPase [Tissierellia bacterium]|nr:AAA family ATPase [Tissierellia bacterium]
MAIPKIKKQDIINALKYIDEKGVPPHNQSTKYKLVTETGKWYPPKYVVAVAIHLAKGTDISTEGFNTIEAKTYLESQNFTIETKQQEKFELSVTAKSVGSTDERFTMDNLSLGNNYKPLDVYFKKANGEVVKRTYSKGERRNSNQTLPRIAFQVFENQISAMSVEDKESFPICKYNPDSPMIRGIYPSVDEFKKHHKTIEYMIYSYDKGRQFVIYCWNIFSTIIFVQECLKRFGEPGDQFILTYREKDKKETEALETKTVAQEELVQQFKGYRNPFSSMLISSKNLIFRGAPGTGKSYLAKEIATDIISNGSFDDYRLLTPEQKKQVEFVQFHPNYDYSDFVEGLRPKINDDGTMGFELQDGIFKKFVARARKNYEDSQKSKETIKKEISVQEAMTDFFSNIELGVDTFKTINGNEFTLTSVDDHHINVSIPGNATVNKLTLKLDDIRKMLESGQKFDRVKDLTTFFGKTFATQEYSYNFAIYKAIKARKGISPKAKVKQEELKKYIFIIDEINRGDISKIFGELFFAIDPFYRGKAGEISTQYSNLHSDPDEKFYIPNNVYIIGTMNDIDRSVDSFDFAMRRRFRFIELRADERLEMLASLENEELEAEAIKKMAALNKEIAAVEDLNENYQIGASYFLKLKTLDFDQLWTDYLHPLLQEYIQGMYDEEGIMNRFAKAYGYQRPAEGDVNETTQDQR